MMTITIVGVGALGSHVVQFLRNLDVTLRLVDFDRVEAKNVMSQFYGQPNVGKNKAVALLQQTSFLFKRPGGADAAWPPRRR
jgi:tRNA A37 threonylcarbamoyladenosine dehydratase